LTLIKDDYESEKFTDNKNSNKVIFTTYCDIKYEWILLFKNSKALQKTVCNYMFMKNKFLNI
jgi:hypothetical protein